MFKEKKELDWKIKKNKKREKFFKNWNGKYNMPAGRHNMPAGRQKDRRGRKNKRQRKNNRIEIRRYDNYIHIIRRKENTNVSSRSKMTSRKDYWWEEWGY